MSARAAEGTRAVIDVSSRIGMTLLRALRRARDRIDREYAEPFDIASLASTAGYSRAHFIRAFQSVYGETPGRYRARRRVERACDLLRSVNLTVTEISCSVGFSSLGTFSARFSELVGMSPSAYRREAERRGGPAPIPGCFALMWWTGLPAPIRGEAPATAEPVKVALSKKPSAGAAPTVPRRHGEEEAR